MEEFREYTRQTLKIGMTVTANLYDGMRTIGASRGFYISRINGTIPVTFLKMYNVNGVVYHKVLLWEEIGVAIYLWDLKDMEIMNDWNFVRVAYPVDQSGWSPYYS